MPKEYLKCVESELKAGKSKDDAQRICAIAFYKRHGISVNEAEKKGMFNQFREYKTDSNSDGSINIRDLEIFKLTKRGNKNYDQNWFKKAQKYFEAEKIDEYLPPAFVGHGEIPGKETEAIGFLDNLKLKDQIVYADILKVSTSVFKLFKDRKYPNRSVELHPKTGQIMGLAFLGKTRPFHKLPLMEFRDEEIETEVVDFQENELIENALNINAIKEEMELEKNISMLEKLWWKLQDIVRAIKRDPEIKSKKSTAKKALQEGLDIIKSEVKKFEEFEDMTPEELNKLKEDIKKDIQIEFEQKFDERYIAKFKEDFGTDPENYKKNLDEKEKQQFSEKKKTVLTAAKDKYHLAPAIVDGYLEPIIDAIAGHENETIKFAEKEQGTIFDLMGKFTESLSKRFQENTLFADLDEYTRFGGDDGNPNFNRRAGSFVNASEEELIKFDQEIEKYAEKHNISYDKAAEKVLAGKK